MLLQTCRRAHSIWWRTTNTRCSAKRDIHTPSSAPTIAASDAITYLKSTFQAYATAVSAQKHMPDDDTPLSSTMRADVIPSLLAHLQDLEPRTRRATHAMYAWRVRSRPYARSNSTDPASVTVLCGSSNGGEAGAGERLERLLELSKCEDVVVIVFRWYGGVKLGSDRWKCISSVAKEALERGGFLSPRNPGSGEQVSPVSGKSRSAHRKKR
ncbi:ribosomal protein S5 domain 2-like protein [Trametes cingulata]|nr:ribosomal protein S5 domain 2-like protein [Trametes cingulata]